MGRCETERGQFAAHGIVYYISSKKVMRRIFCGIKASAHLALLCRHSSSGCLGVSSSLRDIVQVHDSSNGRAETSHTCSPHF